VDLVAGILLGRSMLTSRKPRLKQIKLLAMSMYMRVNISNIAQQSAETQKKFLQGEK